MSQQRPTVTILEAILRNAPDVLRAITEARERGIPDHEMRVFVSFDHQGQMRVEVNRVGDERHRALMVGLMAPDNLEAADVVVHDSPFIGAHPADVLGLLRR